MPGRMIQVLDVPEALHRKLGARAAEQGLTLSDCLLAELRRLADRGSPQELAARARRIVREDLRPSAAEIVRADRDRRS